MSLPSVDLLLETTEAEVLWIEIEETPKDALSKIADLEQHAQFFTKAVLVIPAAQANSSDAHELDERAMTSSLRERLVITAL